MNLQNYPYFHHLLVKTVIHIFPVKLTHQPWLTDMSVKKKRVFVNGPVVAGFVLKLIRGICTVV